MQPDLSCTIGRLRLKSPLLAASGTGGFGQELESYININELGGLVTKGLSLRPRAGNQPPRLCETMSGMLNSIGLANPGLEIFARDKLPYLQRLAGQGCLIVVNMYGESEGEFIELTKELSLMPGIGALELNLSCPNVSGGGMAFGVSEADVFRITRAVRRHTGLPLWVKLSPNVTDIVSIAKAAAKGGAEAISIINTLLGTAIDARRRQFKLGNIMGGLSGPAIKPVALRMVLQTAAAIDLPIVGMGGISSGSDVVEFFLAGACAVQIGSASFLDPASIERIRTELFNFCLEEKIGRLESLRGQLVSEHRIKNN